jgi:hypothetical protein
LLDVPSVSHVDLWSYSPWPQLGDGEREVEFHPVYQGPLPAAGQGGGKTRTREKHEIRKVFHKQLESLWRIHPFLVDLRVDKAKLGSISEMDTWRLEDRYERCGYKFLPLVSSFFSGFCSLDILFLRRDGPGQLIKSGGISTTA